MLKNSGLLFGRYFYICISYFCPIIISYSAFYFLFRLRVITWLYYRLKGKSFYNYRGE